MPKTIAVVGATGLQGGAVAEKFLSLGWNVRGITRNTTSEGAQALRSRGIEVVSADLDDPSSLIPVFSGVEVIFGVTDFWAPFWAKLGELVQISDRATGEYAYELEIKRGKAIVDAAAEVLTKEGKLERFVLSTLPPVRELSKGKYTYVYHFDSKAEVTKYLQQEKKDLWERSSLLNMGMYTTNMKKYGPSLGRWENNGTFRKFVFDYPADTKAPQPHVVPTDAGIFVDLLVRAPPKQNLMGVSEMETYETFWKTWSQVTGIDSQIVEITVEKMDQLIPGGPGRETAESAAASTEFGWGDLVLPNDLDPSVKTTTLKEYIENEDWSEFKA